MPSFLSKVFGRKKDDRDNQPLGPGELLGGKFEAVSPPVSPTTANYPGLGSDPQATVPSTSEERDFGFLFFRSKSRPSSPKVNPRRLLETLPALSLDFHESKDTSASNGHIFADLDPELALSDVVIGQRRLNPVEALILIRACSQAITSRGLETLGIMTPHWYSSSLDVQRGLISKFLTSLAVTSPSSSQAHNFETEVNSTRSIHDVAAVLRWGFRHLQLEGDAFGTDDGWYKAFLDAEAAIGYPPKAFSEKLEPSLPKSHLDLLISTLELFSSLAAFSESNSTSGSKLSKVFGLWLLTARRIEDKDDWRTFYGRWERTGRMMEHLFLARIRDQSTDQRMPVRLLELVQKYPYTQSPTADLQLLSHPPFTTPLHDALYVRVNYEVTSQALIPKSKIHPSALVADALSTKLQEGEYVELWTKITEAASKTGSESPLGNVLATETIHTLSLVADKTKEDVRSPSFSLLSLIDPPRTSPAKPSTESAPITTPPLSPIGSNWEHFSASGFLEVDTTLPPLASTLFDTDVEKTVPPDPPAPVSRRSSKHAAGRKSTEIARSLVVAGSSEDIIQESVKPELSTRSQQVITSSNLEIIQLDEAFVDFWSDVLLDPIAADWPTFVVCKFKPALVPDLTVGIEEPKKTVKWLVLEQVYTVKALSPPLLTQSASTEAVGRPASPQTPSGRRLFNFWVPSRTPSSSSTASQRTRKTIKTPKVGEMGELVEEDEGRKDTIKVKLPGFKKQKSVDLSSDKQSAEKKSETRDRTKSMVVTKPETSSKIPTIVETNENVAIPGAIVASGAAVVAAVVQHYTEQPAENATQEELGPKQGDPLEATPDGPLPPTRAEVANEDARQVDVPVPKQSLPNAVDPSVSEPPFEVLISEVVAISNIEHPVPEELSNKGLDVEVPTKGDDLAVDLPAEVPLMEKGHSVSVPPAVPQVESLTPSNIPAEVMGAQAGEHLEVAQQNVLLQETVGMKSLETENFAATVEKLAVQDAPAIQSVPPVTTAGYAEEDNVADRLLPVTIDSIAPAAGEILEQPSALVEGVSAAGGAPAVEETHAAVMEEPVAVEGVSTAPDEAAHAVSEEPMIESLPEVLEELHTAGVTSTLPSEEITAVESEQVIEAPSEVSHTVEAPALAAYDAVESLLSLAEEPTEPSAAGLSAVPPFRPSLELSALTTEEPSSVVASTEEIPNVETEPTSGPYPEGELPVEPIERPAVEATTEMESYAEEAPVEEGDKEVFSSFADDLAGTIEGLSPPDNIPLEDLPVVEPAAPAEETVDEPTITVEEESGAAQEVPATEAIAVDGASPEEAVQVVEEAPPVLTPELKDGPPLDDMPVPVGEISEVEEPLAAAAAVDIEEVPAKVEEPSLVLGVDPVSAEEPSSIVVAESPAYAEEVPVIEEAPGIVEEDLAPTHQPPPEEQPATVEEHSVPAEGLALDVEDVGVLAPIEEGPVVDEDPPLALPAVGESQGHVEEPPFIVEEGPAPTGGPSVPIDEAEYVLAEPTADVQERKVESTIPDAAPAAVEEAQIEETAIVAEEPLVPVVESVVEPVGDCPANDEAPAAVEETVVEDSALTMEGPTIVEELHMAHISVEEVSAHLDEPKTTAEAEISSSRAEELAVVVEMPAEITPISFEDVVESSTVPVEEPPLSSEELFVPGETPPASEEITVFADTVDDEVLAVEESAVETFEVPTVVDEAPPEMLSHPPSNEIPPLLGEISTNPESDAASDEAINQQNVNESVTESIPEEPSAGVISVPIIDEPPAVEPASNISLAEPKVNFAGSPTYDEEPLSIVVPAGVTPDDEVTLSTTEFVPEAGEETKSTFLNETNAEPALDMSDGDGHMRSVSDETETTFVDPPLVVHKGSEQIENAGIEARVNYASADLGEMGSKESDIVTESKAFDMLAETEVAPLS